MRRLVNLLIPCVFLCGCFGPGEGVEVPQDQIYFPVGLALDAPSADGSGPAHLFVVSSDFDLQYNGGAVQSYRLDDLQNALPALCNDGSDCPSGECEGGLCIRVDDSTPCKQGDRAGADRLLFPGRCNPIVVAAKMPPGAADGAFIVPASSVKIGAFATDVILRERPANGEDGKPLPNGDPERLFVPVRGDSTLHWIDVADGQLKCGQHNSGASGACDARHRAGDDPAENSRGITLNAEPFAIDADERGDTIVVTNQTTGTASLFVNDLWDDNGPLLKFALASASIPSRPVGIAAVPQPLSPGEKREPHNTFMMTFRNSAQVRLFYFAPDGEGVDATGQTLGSSPSRPYLVDGSFVPIDANSVGSDSRGITIDASARAAAKQSCAEGDATCAGQAGLVPLDVYVANRSPSSLLIGRTGAFNYPYFFQTLPLTTGPSRVVVGHVTTPSGEIETRVFVVCFDSRRIFVYDPLRSRIETEILTGRGPYAVAVDEQRKLLYVGHFTDSYVGVYSLDLAFPATYGTLLGTLGTPKAPRSSK